MVYVDSSPADVVSSALKRAYKASLDEGVCYGSDGMMQDGKAALIKNMWLKNGVLTSRKKFTDTGFALDGDCIHASACCFEHEFIHAGSRLYSAGEEGFVELYSGLPDKNGFFVEFSGKLYLFCDTHIYSVNNQLEATEEFPYCPVYSRQCLVDSGSVNVTVEDFVPNIVAPVCRIYYTGALNSVSYRFHFPKIMDKTRPYKIYVEDTFIDPSLYTTDENNFYLTKDLCTGSTGDVSICCYVEHKNFEKCNIISGCTAAVTYGGNTFEGTRVFVAGNKEYPGKYFMSEQGQPLIFKEDACGVAGNGTEDITVFSKQHSDLLVFTENTVSRMRYNYTSENGGYFSMHLINSDIGCDAPCSTASVENRTVFANSKKGIYIVDSTDNFDLMNVLPVWKNIRDDSGENGYLSVTSEDRKKARALTADGRYMLLCADKMFIWDYGNTPYISSSDYMKSETGLAWFEFDGFNGFERIFDVNGNFFAVKKEPGGDLMVYEQGDGNEACVYAYRSGNSALGNPFNDKYVTCFEAVFRTEKNTDISISFYGDGKHYATHRQRIIPGKDGLAVIVTKVPKYACRHFAFEIKVSECDVGVADVGFDYVIKKKTGNYLR